jgi:hypothetical protein
VGGQHPSLETKHRIQLLLQRGKEAACTTQRCS